MVTTFADAPFSTPELEELLLAGGELTWAAGPLAKGSNLCHGTGGNGYAFLKLSRRTRDTRRRRTEWCAAASGTLRLGVAVAPFAWYPSGTPAISVRRRGDVNH